MGVPVHDDRKHFEFLVLEGAQAGLSWTIVLKKREGSRRAFDEFEPEKVARLSARRSETLALDSAIIRNRMKVEAAARNARAFLKIQEEFGIVRHCVHRSAGPEMAVIPVSYLSLGR
jgi:DNA-3-methyladenine glycosylase I